MGTHRTLAKKKNPRKVKASQRPTKLKQGIQPGQVLILLGGRFRGRRVVFLKQLESGLLLVTGPYSVNGVPLRRVNQRFVIATSTKVDVKGADVSKVSDAFFARDKKKQEKGESGFFTTSKATEGRSDEKKAAQKKCDGGVKCDGDIKAYLKA